MRRVLALFLMTLFLGCMGGSDFGSGGDGDGDVDDDGDLRDPATDPYPSAPFWVEGTAPDNLPLENMGFEGNGPGGVIEFADFFYDWPEVQGGMIYHYCAT